MYKISSKNSTLSIHTKISLQLFAYHFSYGYLLELIFEIFQMYDKQVWWGFKNL